MIVIPPTPENRNTRAEGPNFQAAGLKPPVSAVLERAVAPPSARAAEAQCTVETPVSATGVGGFLRSMLRNTHLIFLMVRHRRCGTVPPSNQGGWVYAGPPGPSANTGRPLSTVGDYRPNMDVVNNPVVDTTTIPFSLADFDILTFEQLGIALGRWDSAQAPQSTPASGNRGGGRNSLRDGGSTGRKGKATAEAEGGSISATDATHYTREESIAVTKAWIVVSVDAIVGTYQKELGLWIRIVKAYEAFKPEGAKERTPGMLRKKWGRIYPAVKRFAGIYDNNLRHADSIMCLEDIKELSMQQHILKPKFPKFTY